jgi:hypothetical protein
MRLRGDPAVSATLAGAFTRNNAAQLNAAIGRAPSEGELYIAQFLGPDGAARLIGAATSEPRANAAAMFPAAAAANPRIFYDRAGRPLAASAVYGRLTGRYDVARALAFAPGGATSAVAPPPDTAAVAQAYAQARNVAPLPDNRPLFQAMFTDRPQGALSPAVNSLWGGAQPSGRSSGLDDLCKDAGPVLRKSYERR